MATIITSECINCGACEPECPNTAIYAGGVEWELNGQKSPALAQDIYYIVPSKCTNALAFTTTKHARRCARSIVVFRTRPTPRRRECSSRGREPCTPN